MNTTNKDKNIIAKKMKLNTIVEFYVPSAEQK